MNNLKLVHEIVELSTLASTTKSTISYGDDTMEFQWSPEDCGEWAWDCTGGLYDDNGILSEKYQELCDSSEISCYDETYIEFFAKLLGKL